MAPHFKFGGRRVLPSHSQVPSPRLDSESVGDNAYTAATYCSPGRALCHSLPLILIFRTLASGSGCLCRSGGPREARLKPTPQPSARGPEFFPLDYKYAHRTLTVAWAGPDCRVRRSACTGRRLAAETGSPAIPWAVFAAPFARNCRASELHSRFALGALSARPPLT